MSKGLLIPFKHAVKFVQACYSSNRKLKYIYVAVYIVYINKHLERVRKESRQEGREDGRKKNLN